MAVIEAKSLVPEQRLVAVAGDWHGQGLWAKQIIESLAGTGVKYVLHLGDFGVWSGKAGKRYLYTVEKALARADMEILVTLGNHEDWARVNSLWDNPKRRDSEGNPLPIQLTEHIQVLPRAYRFELAGVSFLSFPGAASVDFEYRTEGHDWWPQELPTREDVNTAVAQGSVDVMLAHETVDSIYAVHPVVNMLQHNPHGWSKRALAYSAKGRSLVTEAFEGVKPALFFHGHMHEYGVRRVELPGASHATLVVSVDKDWTSKNVFLLDLEAFKARDPKGDFEHVVFHPMMLEDSDWREARGL